MARDKASLDLFRLKDDSLEQFGRLIAGDITDTIAGDEH